ncbi:hypothetical protein CMI38_00480 [Candidatus Pacearchaeota archaeon]|nr:hypothetical protein [Candidatus Pacearchaeota archaeon]|tara:strand:+ start:1122 stop:1358 length:237 start_codon:yes stop_codon:yes gene_type:complete
MTNQKLQIYYDVEEDILEIQIGEPTETYYDEIEDDVFEGHDEQTDELKGYKIFNFKKRGGMKNVSISLPANVSISASN